MNVTYKYSITIILLVFNINIKLDINLAKHDLKCRNTRCHLEWTVGNENPMHIGYSAQRNNNYETRGINRSKNNNNSNKYINIDLSFICEIPNSYV